MGRAPAGCEKISSSLARYFERRLLGTTGGDQQRSLPLGYRAELHKELGGHVLRHEVSGICVSIYPIDLVERVDRSICPEPARILYVYLADRDAFERVAALAFGQPRQAWKRLVEAKVLRPIEEAAEGTWYGGPATSTEPAARAADGRRASGDEPPWHAAHPARPSAPRREAQYCIALHLLARRCRAAAAQGGCAAEAWFPGPAPQEAGAGLWTWPPVSEPKPEVELGLQLVEAAGRRDAEAVRALLEARANPDFQDARGYTALHAACAARPKWEVLDQLLTVCDLCARTHTGLLPCDLADLAAHDDAAKAVKELMQQHRKAKHLPAASSALTTAAKAALGLTAIDWEAASKAGKRRSDGEALKMLRDFSTQVMSKYQTADAAFKAFDINSNGTLSVSEFVQSAKQLKLEGRGGRGC